MRIGITNPYIGMHVSMPIDCGNGRTLNTKGIVTDVINNDTIIVTFLNKNRKTTSRSYFYRNNNGIFDEIIRN